MSILTIVHLRPAIRTYSVVPLNEECGLIEWVPNVVVLRSILNKLYARHNVPPWVSAPSDLFEEWSSELNNLL